MKRVYICAPLSDNPNRDVIEAVRFIIRPHLFSFLI